MIKDVLNEVVIYSTDYRIPSDHLIRSQEFEFLLKLYFQSALLSPPHVPEHKCLKIHPGK